MADAHRGRPSSLPRSQQRQYAQRRRQRAGGAARCVGLGHQTHEADLPVFGQRRQRLPELRLQRHRGAMPGEGEAALDQPAQFLFSNCDKAQEAESETSELGSDVRRAAMGRSAGSAELPLA